MATIKAVNPNDESKKPDDKAKPAKSKPAKFLPTDRITFARQIDLLRAYGIASQNGAPVTNKSVAEIVKMSDSTTSLANPFFVENGFLTKTDAGFVPAQEVVLLARAHEWNADTSSQKLAPIMLDSWFGKALLPKLRFQQMDDNEAVAILAEAIKASPDYRGQIQTVLDYLAAGGLIQREGGMVKIAKGGSEPEGRERPAAVEPAAKEAGVTKPLVNTRFVQPNDGSIEFQIQVRVGMQEMSNWSPERIAAFFGGVAQVLAAKGKLEKDSAGEN